MKTDTHSKGKTNQKGQNICNWKKRQYLKKKEKRNRTNLKEIKENMLR